MRRTICPETKVPYYLCTVVEQFANSFRVIVAPSSRIIPRKIVTTSVLIFPFSRWTVEYIRNFYPKLPYLQPNLYKDKKPFMVPLKQLHADGKLNAVQSLILAETRPEEELYFLSEDPWEIRNLANDPKHFDKLREMRTILSNWIIESDDQGRFPESDAAYDSQMKGYLDSQVNRGRIEAAQQLQENINLMKQWKAEGK